MLAAIGAICSTGNTLDKFNLNEWTKLSESGGTITAAANLVTFNYTNTANTQLDYGTLETVNLFGKTSVRVTGQSSANGTGEYKYLMIGSTRGGTDLLLTDVSNFSGSKDITLPANCKKDVFLTFRVFRGGTEGPSGEGLRFTNIQAI